MDKLEKILKGLEVLCSILVVVALVALVVDDCKDIMPDSLRVQYYLSAIVSLNVIILLRIDRILHKK